MRNLIISAFIIALCSVIIVWRLSPQFNYLTELFQSHQEHPLSFKERVTIANQRLAEELLVQKRRADILSSIQQVTDYQEKQSELDALDAESQAISARFEYINPTTFDIEQAMDQGLIEQFEVAASAVMTEWQRLQQDAEIAAYVTEQHRQTREQSQQALLVTPDQPHPEWQQQIEQDREAFLADIHARQDAWTGAPEALEDVKSRLDVLLHQHADWPDAQVGLARYYINLAVLEGRGQLKHATTALSAAHSLDPDNASYALFQGSWLNQYNMSQAALKSLQQAKDKGASPGHVAWFQSVALAKMERAGERRRVLDEALANSSILGHVRARILAERADQALRDGELASAATWFQEATVLHPRMAWLPGNYAAKLLTHGGDPKAALAMVGRAEAIEPYGYLTRVRQQALYAQWALAVQAGKPKPETDRLLLLAQNSGLTPRGMMAEVGKFAHTGVAKALIQALSQRGLDVNSQTRDGDTALLHAVGLGYQKTAALLVQAGANLELVGRTRTTPLLEAITRNQPSTALLLLTLGADPHYASNYTGNALLQAAFAGQSEVVNALVAKGADVNKEWRGERPLSSAVINGHLDTVKALLAHGAKRDYLIMGKWSVEEAARQQSFPEIVALLTDKKPAE